MANMAAPKILRKSFLSTFSLFMKGETSQNSRAAPKIRTSVTVTASTSPPSMTNLEIGAIAPHITLAENIAICPVL